MRHHDQWLAADESSHLSHESVWERPVNVNHVVLPDQSQPASVDAADQNVGDRQQLHISFADFVSCSFFMCQRFDTRRSVAKTFDFDAVESVRLESFVGRCHHGDFVAFLFELAVNFSHPWDGVVGIVTWIG